MNRLRARTGRRPESVRTPTTRNRELLQFDRGRGYVDL